MKKFCLVFISGLILLSCSDSKDVNPNELVILNDYETVRGYYETPSNNSDLIVKIGDAFSGKHVCQTDSINKYGMLFKISIEELAVKPIKKITVTAQIKFIDVNDAGSLTMSIDSADKNLFWTGFSSKQLQGLRADMWTEISFSIDAANVPQLLNKSAKFTSYFLNDSKGKILVDDYKIAISY
jgi:hypothetical protein